MVTFSTASTLASELPGLYSGSSVAFTVSFGQHGKKTSVGHVSRGPAVYWANLRLGSMHDGTHDRVIVGYRKAKIDSSGHPGHTDLVSHQLLVSA